MTEPGRLLPGEDPDTTFEDDARHFVSVYAELLHFQEVAVSQAEESQEAADGEHLAHLRVERDRLQRRLEFWQRRHHELSTTT
jgi:hypothetical protein